MRPIDRGNPSYRRALFRPVDEGGLWLRRDVEPFVPESTAVGEHVGALVNDGRWLVQCRCGSAQLVDPNEPRFFCVECLNDHVGGQWVAVRFPGDTGAIEEALEQREHRGAMNWRPGETVEDLLAENEAHGVGA